ncbi:MAG: hypothetical protein K2W95_27225 [Candidatus Obscuribacterales bacterium]|nr:hypothetical protein [Candidatus Obscuribacterales bacterium]
MPERSISGFKLSSAVVVCPECRAPFHKELLTDIPPLSPEDVVEADLHRVFPDPIIRASLLGVCPECKYCAWSTSFGNSNLNPALARREPLLPYTKKYAVAVKCARSRNMHPLDIAFIALNGLWCAREAGEDDLLWLELVAYEHSRGMTDYPSVQDEDGMAHLMMAEIWRQLKQFDQARREYELALNDATIMPEIIRHQIGLCDRKVSAITALPLHVVRQLFPEEEKETQAKEAAEEPAQTKLPTVSPEPVASGPAEETSAEQPKMTAETAMLSAISTLLSAQATLLAEEAEAEANQHEAATQEALAAFDAKPVIRPARQRTAQPETSGTNNPLSNTAAPVVAPLAPKSAPLQAGIVEQPAPATPQPQARLPFPQGNPGMAQAVLGQQMSPAPALAPVVQSAPPEPPPLRNVPGIKCVKNGNAVARVRHSHKFKHALAGPVRQYQDNWQSDYAPTPVRLPAQPPREYQQMPNPYYDRPVEVQSPVELAPLPDFEIEGFTKDSARANKAIAQAQPAQQSQPLPQYQATQEPAAAGSNAPAQQQAAVPPGQSPDHTDAIARVESYLSFSRALHTRSFLKYN